MMLAASAAACVIAPTVAQAITDVNLRIKNVGVQENTGYVRFETPTSATCAYGVVYFDLSTDGGRSILASVMSAHLAGKSLSRIDYALVGGNCNASLVEF
ncbi:hypothetical protein [Novosphingobium sp.]|jgi:hypothetical protein|uniref:hypothetical protein n=1 Tax=Novosphingobium sp. TaxID=1874826 RepID=UPI002FE18991